MSDASQGEGWWLASDNKWYPPESRYYPPPPSFPVALAPKKLYQRVWFWIVIAMVICMGGCTAVVVGVGVNLDHRSHIRHTVVYSLKGTGQAGDIYYDTEQEGAGQHGSEQLPSANLPWRKVIVVSGLFTGFELSASVEQGGGTLTCTITQDGKTLSTRTVKGAFHEAICSSAGFR